MEDWLVLVLALGGGFAVGALTIGLLALLRRRAPAKTKAEPEVVPFEAVEDDAPAPFEPVEDHFGVTHAPRGNAPSQRVMSGRPLDESVAPTEWAARVSGPLPPGHTRGVCSGCGTPLSVGPRRPLRIACPECGRTRLLA